MQKNREQLPGVTPGLLDQFTSLFFNRCDVYAVQRSDGHYIYRQAPMTPDLITAHFLGQVTLGTYALSQENTAKWVVLDADDAIAWTKLIALAHTPDLALHLEQSRRGGHAWAFLAEPVPGMQARQFAQRLLALQHLTPKDVEIYPKQNHLTDGPGSLMRLPFGYHRKVKVAGKPGQRFGFQDRAGNPLASTIHEQIALLMAAERVPHATLARIAATLPELIIPPPTPTPLPLRATAETMPLSERVKARIGVLAFVSQYVPLDEQGRGFCPFHADEHESFGVNIQHNYWSCFAGCGGGSIIDFWRKWREKQGQDGSFTATITDLARILQL